MSKGAEDIAFDDIVAGDWLRVTVSRGGYDVTTTATAGEKIISTDPYAVPYWTNMHGGVLLVETPCFSTQKIERIF